MTRSRTFALAVLLLIPLLTAYAHADDKPKLDTAAIERTTGLKGELSAEEGVFKVSSPRTDVEVKVDGSAFPPFMGLTSWAAFQAGVSKEAMVMGDLVLFEDEVNPVMSELFAHGLTVTALHNHFFFTQPQVYFMHIGGEGSTAQLAKGVRAALDKVKTIRSADPAPAKSFGGEPIATASSVSVELIETAIGHKPQAKDGMAKVTIGGTVKADCGCTIGKAMGVNTWAVFAGTDDHAIVCGDFVMTANEVQPVLRSLRASGINIVALHNHMTNEQPALYFTHYWGKGRVKDLATAIKSALDAQAAVNHSDRP